MEKFVEVLSETHGIAASPIAAQLFGSAGIEHMRRYGVCVCVCVCVCVHVLHVSHKHPI